MKLQHRPHRIMSATRHITTDSPFSKEGYAKQEWGNHDFVLNRFLKSLEVSSKDGSAEGSIVGVALFGTGRMGSHHLSSVVSSNNMALKYVVEADKGRWDACRRGWHLDDDKVRFLLPEDASRAVEDPAVRVSIVATPAPFHEEIIRLSLAAGKHVFCEKPVAPTVAAVESCYRMAAERGRMLFCAFNRRFDPSHQDLYDRIRAGEVGRVQMIRTISRDSPTNPMEYTKISGGIFFDSACHDIDLITHTIAELPSKVYAAGSKFHAEYADLPGDYDTINVTMHFPSGALGNFEIIRHCSFGYDQRMEVFGADGMLVSENQTPLGTRLWNRSGIHAPRINLGTFSRYWEGYKRELEHFVADVLAGKTEPSITGKMVLAVFKVCAACQESADTGRPVELKWDRDEVPQEYR